MKTNKVPAMTRKRIAGLSGRDLMHLRDQLSNLWHLRAGLTPANDKRMRQAMNWVDKERAKRKREFWKDKSYRTPAPRKVKSWLASAKPEHQMSAYAEALGVDAEQAKELVNGHYEMLRDGPPIVSHRRAA